MRTRLRRFMLSLLVTTVGVLAVAAPARADDTVIPQPPPPPPTTDGHNWDNG